MKSIKKLLKDTSVSKEKLYEKYSKYHDWNKSMKNNEVLIASKVLNVDYGNKSALFFMIVGLIAIEKEIKVLIEEN